MWCIKYNLWMNFFKCFFVYCYFMRFSEVIYLIKDKWGDWYSYSWDKSTSVKHNSNTLQLALINFKINQIKRFNEARKITSMKWIVLSKLHLSDIDFTPFHIISTMMSNENVIKNAWNVEVRALDQRKEQRKKKIKSIHRQVVVHDIYEMVFIGSKLSIVHQ